ncbi:MAG: HAMP domain-containing histidine kinase [Planctomycetes bacterium]|nr:HAMP domain-containing histidine kinase [Planctomycetota bacterium]
MKPVSINTRLVQRAYWLIRLRWIATVSVAVGTYFSSTIWGMDIQDSALYCIAFLLALYNAITLMLLNNVSRVNREVPYNTVKKIINFQISIDLLILTFVLHFSGGIENPFIFYFIFHMIISSILLSVRASYFQGSLAIFLFGSLLLLEYTDLIPHYCLLGFVPHCLYKEGFFVLGTFLAFSTAMYLVIYMASYIATRLKRAEQAHIEANKQLLEKDRIKDEYVLRVTHDIKGHLAAIQSCLDVVVNKLVGPLNEKQSDFVNRAHNRTRKLTEFVRTLLKLTRMRLSDKLEMDFFFLDKTIESALASVSNRAEEKQIRLDVNIEASIGKVYGSQFSIEEMIMNLLLNGIKYTPENGEVRINAKSTDHSVLVEIIDTGIGIPKDEIDKVFDEFYRCSNARKIEKDGTGLGLSIAKQIVDHHGGEIGVESQEGEGTRLWFTFAKGVSFDSRVQRLSEE